MFIKEDYSYIPEREKELLKTGYAELDISSLNFNRYYTEEEQQENRARAKTMTDEERNIHCDKVSKNIHQNMLPIAEFLSGKYDIHQITEGTSTMEHYRSNWDLYFYSNKGWNGKDHFDHMQLSFNDNRPAAQNLGLKTEIVGLLKDMIAKNVCCRVQYRARLDEEKLAKGAKELFKSWEGGFVSYRGMIGRVKELEDYNSNYGFFKKGAHKRYYPLSDADLLFIEKEA